MKIIVDETLTPENAKGKGFIWWQDVLYDPEAPAEANKEFEEYLQKGWKLGQPTNRAIKQNGGIGLYKPINSNLR